MIAIEIDSTPPTVNQAYKKYRNRVVLSNRAKEFKRHVFDLLPEGYNMLKGPVKLDITLYFKDRRKRDIDNYLKILLDSMKNVYFEDDDQIIELCVRKIIKHDVDKTIIVVSSV